MSWATETSLPPHLFPGFVTGYPGPLAKMKDLQSSESLLDEQHKPKAPVSTSLLRNSHLVLLHGGLFGLYTLTFLLLVILQAKHPERLSFKGLIYSPAREAITYERQELNGPLGAKSRFVGEPDDQIDQAWNHLLKYMNVRVQQDELERINRSSIPLNDAEGGYLVALDVYHELHCLNILRKQIYRSFYPDRHTVAKQLEHADHCIDTLRQVLMCHGDIAVMTYDWIDDYRWPWPNFHTDHECRRWDRLEEWGAKRHVPSLKGPILTHPVLGVSYRGGSDE